MQADTFLIVSTFAFGRYLSAKALFLAIISCEIFAALVLVNCDNLAIVCSTFANFSGGRFFVIWAIHLLDSLIAFKNPSPPVAAISAI